MINILYHHRKLTHCCWQIYDMIEVFSGTATLSRSVRSAGYSACSMDIQDWKGHVMSRQKHGCPVTCGNPLDLLSPAGYAPFACIMNWRPILEHPANQSTQPPAKVAPLDNIEVPAWICRDVRLGLLVLRQCQQRLNQTALLFAVRGRDSPVCAARQSTCQ